MADPQLLAEQMEQAIERDLRAIVSQLEPPALQEMVAHHFGWLDGKGSGKGVRPLTCTLACAAAGGKWQQALPAASSVELIHNFSLIHDDIQDQSELRRHRPTVWKVWGAAQAINTGDALFALARISVHRMEQNGLTADRVLQVQRWIDDACLELTKGQHMDLAFDVHAAAPLDRYLRMIRAKTSSLLAASAAAGAAVATADPEVLAAYHDFGMHLGLAFQILDDVLGTWGAQDATGKSAADDLTTRKPTYAALYGLQQSPDFARLWDAPESTHRQMVEALDGVEARSAAQTAAAEHTQRALTSLDQAAPAAVAGEALRGLADRLLARQA